MAEIAALIGGPAFAAIIAYLSARWRYSGRVDPTDARKLWDEARALRNDYVERIDRLVVEMDAKDVRLAQLDKRVEELRGENSTLRLEIAAKDERILELTGRVFYLEQELRGVRDREKRIGRTYLEEDGEVAT